MRITILTYLESEGAKEYDGVADQVAAALRRGGHTPNVQGVHGDIGKLVRDLKRRKPDLVFHLLEMFGGKERGDVEVAGLLDLMEIPHTGGGPAELSLRMDKGLAKKMLAFDGILYPDFAVFSRDDFETGGNLRMPMFVKPLRTDASVGIGKASLVHDVASLMKRVAAIHKTVGDSALAEEYIEGREFYVGVLGNRDPVAFPPMEMDFSGLPKGAPRVLDSKAKWDVNSAEYKGTKAVAADVPAELLARLQKVSVDAYRAVKVRDYGRVDLRYTETGEIYVIEVNANCYLEESGEFAAAAALAGLDYTALVNGIVDAAVARHALAG